MSTQLEDIKELERLSGLSIDDQVREISEEEQPEITEPQLDNSSKDAYKEVLAMVDRLQELKETGFVATFHIVIKHRFASF